MNQTLHAGWYLVATEDDLTADITPLDVGGRRLMVTRTASDDGDAIFTVADATCPHRGAHLGYGGVLDRDCVVCPFHGRRIVVGEHPTRPFVSTHPTLQVGPLVFARFATDPAGDCDFSVDFAGLVADREIRVAVHAVVDMPVEFVVENAFDSDHFSAVHQVPGLGPMTTAALPSGALRISGDFRTMADPWYDMRYAAALNDFVSDYRGTPTRSSGFEATAYSPTIVSTAFGEGPRPPLIVTMATPTSEGVHIRVAIVGGAHDPLDSIAVGAKIAIAQDIAVWKHIDPDAPWQLDDLDAGVIAFRRFVADFPPAASPAPAPSGASA